MVEFLAFSLTDFDQQEERRATKMNFTCLIFLST